MLGVHPGHFSLRELYRMYRGRQKRLWDAVVALAVRILPEAPVQNPYRELEPEKVAPFSFARWDAFLDAMTGERDGK